MALLYLSDAEVAASLSPAEALVSQRAAYLAVVDGRGSVLSAAHADDTGAGALVYTRSGMVSGSTGVTVKAGIVQAGNAARGRPTVSAIVALFDPDTGRPLAFLNGEALTLLRTAAGLAVAADALAVADADRLGVLGSGPQAEHVIRMVSAVRPIRRVSVWSPNPDHREALAHRLHSDLDAEVVSVASASAVVEDHQILATCTSSREPVVLGEWLSPGQTVLTMGSVETDRSEIDLAATLAATTVVDTLQQTLVQCGPVVDALRSGHRVPADFIEIGAVLSGQHPGRASPDDVVIFHSVGCGHQDATAAWIAYRNAVAAGRGTLLEP